MKVRRNVKILLPLTLLLLLLVCSTALAGPFVDLRTTGNHILSTEEIIDTLYSIEAASDGLVDVFTLTEFAAGPVTKSEAGRELYVAKVGTGPTVVWITANIHGNEKVVSHGVLSMLKYLSQSHAAPAKLIRDQLTVYMVPSMNPDGRERNTRGTWLYNDDGTPTMEPVPGKEGQFQQVTVDLNRDWHMGWVTGQEGAINGLRADETKAWYAFWAKIKPDYLFDMHHQGSPRMPYGYYIVDGSLGISLSPDRNTMPEQYKDPVRQLMGYTYDHLLKFGFKNITRYQLGTDRELDYKGGMTSACYLGNKWINWLDLNPDDHRTICAFLEMRTDTAGGLRANNYAPPVRFMGAPVSWFARMAHEFVYGVLYGIASGQAFGVNPQHWYDIPAYGPVKFYYTDENYFLPAAADAWGYVPAEWELALDIL